MSKYLITGGAGFIGCNTAKRFIEQGHQVIIFDNLSREGSQLNLQWLYTQGEFVFIKGDIRNYTELVKLFTYHPDIDVVIHLAAQVAVTTSTCNPREDFEVNALGTFNLLEAIRETGIAPIVLYSSTNKVYGAITNIPIIKNNGRYQYKNLRSGIPETQPLDFHSPYGCSKGCADQYVLDYARIYNMKTICLRQSCIYGPHQFGVEDQGWVAWFTISAMLDQPITIYGDGCQVRDVLYINDLIEAVELAIAHIDITTGKAYNIGGGVGNQISLLELIAKLERLWNKKIYYCFSDWRPGDQRVFICDISKSMQDFGWQPRTNIDDGLANLSGWIWENRKFFVPKEIKVTQQYAVGGNK